VNRILSLLLLISLAGCNRPAASEPAAAATTKREVGLEIVDYAGILARVASHPGKVVVMDAWSTSCEPCLKEFPNLVKLSQKYAGQVACISLSFDFEGLGKPEEQREKVLAFLRSQRATFENLLSNEASDDLFAKFKLPSIPAVFVYDQQGRLAQRFDSGSAGGKGFTYRDVEAKVAELLAKNP
jgi:thiol-disulfide isomerase/thioredoxin